MKLSLPNKPLQLFLLILLFQSCKKYLDLKPDSSITVPKTVKDLQAMMDDGLYMNISRTPASTEASADDYFLLQSDFNTQRDQDKYLYTWMAYANYTYPNDWASNYTPIFTANYCLDNIDKAPKTTTALADNVKGSALFYRGYYFLQLAWTFSKAYAPNEAKEDMGIALRLGSDFNTKSVRATLQETYDQIISDIKSSILLLPNTSQHPFRPSKAAAYGALARVYLTMQNYDSSLKYSSLCLSLNNRLIDFNGDDDLIGDINGTSTPFKRFNKETIFYTDMSENVSAVHIYYAKMDTTLYGSYASNDLRKRAYFTPNGEYQQFKGNYSGDDYKRFTGIATDEVYLIQAESYARKGDVLNSLLSLNKLLSHRYDKSFSPLTASNPEEALDLVLSERRKELTSRGLRFIDIKRLNKSGKHITQTRVINGTIYTLSPNSNKYALPLPKDIIDLTGMPQNPI